MIRTPGWEAALTAYLAGERGRSFAWGRHDCVLFAAGALLAMTGEDPAAHARGRYRSASGSARVLRRNGWRTLEAMMDAHLKRVPPAFAQRGDIVIADGSLGVCIGRNAMFVGEAGGVPGLVARPLADWTAAWRVPFHAAEGLPDG